VNEEQTTEAPRKRAVPVRAILVLALVGALIVFGFLNATPVRVRPFGYAPLYLVLIAPLLAGVVLGWVIRARIGSRRRRSKSSGGGEGNAA